MPPTKKPLYPRYCQANIKTALADSPVVVLTGPRQCGKTTLAKSMQTEDSVYLTLDDQTQLQLARDDPIGFIRGLTARHIIIDEAQRVPELFLAIKQSVDEDRLAGRYLLTGSANALMLPSLADSLAGRMETLSLQPLAQCEIAGCPSTFLSTVFSQQLPRTDRVRVREELIHHILSGGFPEPLRRADLHRRQAWYHQYLHSLLQKDVRDLAQINHISELPKLVYVLSQYVGQLTNYDQLAGRLRLSPKTMVKYCSLLEQLYVFEQLPAWHRNELKRLIKTPKVHIVDTGLLCALRRINGAKLAQDSHLLGSLVESYVFCELKRLASWYQEPVTLYHFRDKEKHEVDFILELHSGEFVAIEAKASATIGTKDFRGLKKLQSLAGDSFLMGIILYDGDHSSQFTDKLAAVPIGALWAS